MDITDCNEPGSDLLRRARRHEQEALTRLTETAGNVSLCTLSRSGSPYPAAKYEEGAVAALTSIRRTLAKREPDQDPTEILRIARAEWLTHAGARPTAAWEAYLAGGPDAFDGNVDGLDELDAMTALISAPEKFADGRSRGGAPPGNRLACGPRVG